MLRDKKAVLFAQRRRGAEQKKEAVRGRTVSLPNSILPLLRPSYSPRLGASACKSDFVFRLQASR